MSNCLTVKLNLVDEGGDNNSTSIDDEDIDEDVENSLYSDIANIEYDYDEEYYEDTEEDNEQRSIPTDPIGQFNLINFLFSSPIFLGLGLLQVESSDLCLMLEQDFRQN